MREYVLPFPESYTAHDCWIAFCGMRNDSAYFMSDKLVQYRVHDTNTSMKGNLTFSKRIKRLLKVAYNAPYDLHNMATKMLEILDIENEANKGAIATAKKKKDDHRVQIDILQTGGLIAVMKLCKLRRSDSFYKSNSINYFIGQLLLAIFGREYMRNHPRKIYGE